MFERLIEWLNGPQSPSPHPENIVSVGEKGAANFYRFEKPISMWQAMKEQRLAMEAGVPPGTTLEVEGKARR
jgi:hypothetical protein